MLARSDFCPSFDCTLELVDSGETDLGLATKFNERLPVGTSWLVFNALARLIDLCGNYFAMGWLLRG